MREDKPTDHDIRELDGSELESVVGGATRTETYYYETPDGWIHKLTIVYVLQPDGTWRASAWMDEIVGRGDQSVA